MTLFRGATLSGGRAPLPARRLGFLVLGLLENGVNLVNLCNVPVEIKYILIEVIILANAALRRWQRSKLA
jgi:ribose/xylose/arabinose/galactoside ABC-type transport system permease subunit